MENTSPDLALNDETDYGLCFSCGPHNSCGLRLKFQRDGDRVTTVFQGRKEHQGFPGYLHGGIISALLDEVMSRVSLLENRWTMTARMEIRFRRPITLDQKVTAIAEKTCQVRGFLVARGRVELPDGEVAAEAQGSFAFLQNEALARMSEGYPRLAREWMRG
jgi:uncharacterized protein (TIGR00369 family)